MVGKWFRYVGMTHAVPMWMLPLWRRVMCRRGVHCFDEVASYDDHDLSCDACGLSVAIKSVDTSYVTCKIRMENDNAAQS